VIILINLPPEAEGNVPWQYITLLLDISAEENLISSSTLREELGLGVPSREEGGKKVVRALGVRFQVAGVVTIAWALKTEPEKKYTMDCYVVNDDDAPFDIIASKAYLDSNQRLEEHRLLDQGNPQTRHNWRRLLSTTRQA
jgi:hypothetical protein